MPSKKIDSVYLEIGVKRAPGEPKKTLKKIQNDINREKLTATIQVLADTARARADIHNLKRSIDSMRATIHAQVTQNAPAPPLGRSPKNATLQPSQPN